MMNIALVGNPNTGKTSLFNVLTGSYEYVGNWAGVTVEKKVGVLKNKIGNLIDLPGIYSLNPISKDEAVASQFLLSKDFSGILNIVDASQLERNLVLTTQLLEYGKPVIIGLNMIDVANGRGYQIDVKKLSDMLSVPVVPIVARTGKGCKELLQQIQPSHERQPLIIHYHPIVEEAIDYVEHALPDLDYPKRWLAVQYLEGNSVIRSFLHEHIDQSAVESRLNDIQSRLEQSSGQTMARSIRSSRLSFINWMLSSCMKSEKEGHETLTGRVDRIVTNNVLGIPLFLLFMYLIFKLTFDWVGGPLSDLLDGFLNGPLAGAVESLLVGLGASSMIQDVILQGIISGVGGVLVFVPQIFILFFCISLIEDSGYMARVAVVMDRFMEFVGLNGKALIPMIIGFGCNVPGIMAARTIEQPKERLLTILLTPLMSCSARLTVYSLFVGTFFTNHQALIVLSLYVLGIVVALILAKIFSALFLKHEMSTFVFELPPYRMPQAMSLLRSTWDKGKGFVKKAGTFIFGGSVLIWFLSYSGPSGFNVEMDHSFLAMIGGILAPILSPIGFGTWQAGAALITGFLAKEVVVSTMNIIYAAPDLQTLQHVIAGQFSTLQAFSFMAFILLYIPCLATVAVIKKETGSSKWTWFSVLYSLIAAYVISLIIYHVGKWIGF